MGIVLKFRDNAKLKRLLTFQKIKSKSGGSSSKLTFFSIYPYAAGLHASF